VLKEPFIANPLHWRRGADADHHRPNMGGKSTYMRQTADCPAGLYQLRSGAKGGDRPIDRIFTRVGAADDLAGGRSTLW
jgi:DNA mismatch repair protein MutS